MAFNTRDSDLRELIQFVRDQGFDDYYLTQAAKRLERMINAGLIDYAEPVESKVKGKM